MPTVTFTGPKDSKTYDEVVKWLCFDRVVVEQDGHVVRHSGKMIRPAYLYWNAKECCGSMHFLTNEKPKVFERELRNGDIEVFSE